MSLKHLLKYLLNHQRRVKFLLNIISLRLILGKLVNVCLTVPYTGRSISGLFTILKNTLSFTFKAEGIEMK